MPLLIRGHKELNDWARAVPSFFWTECPVTPLCTQRFICKFISSFVNTSVACWNMRFVPGVKHRQRLNSKEKGPEVKSPVSLPWQWVVCVWGARVAVLGQGEFGVEQSSLLGCIWQRWCRSPHAQELPPSLELLPDSGTAAIWPGLFLAHAPQLGTAELVAQESFDGL